MERPGEARLERRPAVRPRRVRHEGRARGDDGRRQAGTRARVCGATSSSRPSSTRRSAASAPTALVRAWRADGAIVAEPTDEQLCVAHKGFVAFEVVTHGRASHGSRPDLGVDAIARMGRVLAAIDELDRALAERGGASARRPRVGPRVADRGRAGVLELSGRVQGSRPSAGRFPASLPTRSSASSTPSWTASTDAELELTFSREPYEAAADEPFVATVHRHAGGRPRGRRVLGRLGAARRGRHPDGALRPARRGGARRRRVGRARVARAVRGPLHGRRRRLLLVTREASSSASTSARAPSRRSRSRRPARSSRAPSAATGSRRPGRAGPSRIPRTGGAPPRPRSRRSPSRRPRSASPARCTGSSCSTSRSR